MLSAPARDRTCAWRARAIAELQSIEEDGLLGPNWQTHPRTVFLRGFLCGTEARLDVDNAARN
jgi:hypothetical protein